MSVKRDRTIFYEIGKRYNIPWQIAEVICVSPFKFANHKIKDPIDAKVIMFAYLFKIKPKIFKFKVNKNDNSSKTEYEGISDTDIIE